MFVSSPSEYNDKTDLKWGAPWLGDEDNFSLLDLPEDFYEKRIVIKKYMKIIWKYS